MQHRLIRADLCKMRIGMEARQGVLAGQQGLIKVGLGEELGKPASRQQCHQQVRSAGAST